MQIEIVDLDELRPDPLNPRRQVTERLEAVALSLSRFGHVLPVFADDDGYIASGHQRSEAARMVGATRVPVVRLAASNPLKRAARLMLFNLATNDTPDRKALTSIAAGLDLAGLVERLAALPEIDVNDPDCWPTMTIDDVPTADLLAANPDVSLGEEGLEGPAQLARGPYYIKMPVVVGADDRVICGRQRLIAAGVIGHQEWPVVRCDGDTDLMALALNKLSMEYDLAGFDDVFRASVWLNHNRIRRSLGIGFIHWVDPKASTKDFDILDPERTAQWREVHGGYVADLGAGHMVETGLLNKAGIRSVAFEPFLVKHGEGALPNRDITRKMMHVFLDEIAEGREFDSVFICAVLNQVPFEEDRFRLLTLAHTLSGKDTVTYIGTPSDSASRWRNFDQGKRDTRYHGFDLRLPGPESRTVLSSIGMGRVMVSKFHTPDELRHLCGQLWREVEVETTSAEVFSRCSSPRPLNPKLVRRMIDHEFDLPWHDGERMGMVEPAVAAFEKRLGVELPSV